MTRRADSHDLKIILADLDLSLPHLEAIELNTPRLSSDQVERFRQKQSALGSDEARRWRAAHVALRIALEREIGPDIRGRAYAIAPGGRPYLTPAVSVQKRPHFSIAHTGGLALLAMSYRGPIGIDLELPRAISVSAARRQRIEATAEAMGAPLPISVDADARFLQAWVRLEAVAKATGIGIGRVLTDAGVVGGNRGGMPPRIAASANVCDLDIGPDRYAAISAASLPQILSVEAFPMTANDLAQFLPQRSEK